jgi:hypothetical protein
LPLVSAGAAVIGNGVLAKASQANVVFCQFPPYTVFRSEAAQPRSILGGDEGQYAQQNLRRTYRRSSCQLARLLANMGVAAPTPLLARFSSPVMADNPEKRWLDAYYVDQPQEWDDPYRFFRW